MRKFVYAGTVHNAKEIQDNLIKPNATCNAEKYNFKVYSVSDLVPLVKRDNNKMRWQDRKNKASKEIDRALKTDGPKIETHPYFKFLTDAYWTASQVLNQWNEIHNNI